ncbi:LapA family protein [Gordonia soli]|uniref:Lipopolysaccharide assembly protein A domain-containing protein n=1 Tax=Gordonia soli NBRC 108243 TaxID=1223545 RepID=M0QNH7_9ACTN|nr:lipopolysaccharide assembly protein LapA domain-containing protein [Gordonia soli]GAC68977.1 hypothetical protein GS4_20_00420 [Gordonia soli NBRC 108243]
MTTPEPQPHDATASPVDPAGAPEHDPEHRKLLAERNALRTKVRDIEHTRTRATFFGLVIGALLMILLLVFILQNLRSEQIMLIFWEVNLPLGVSLLIAAIAGALITALVGGLRMLQMSRALKRARK